MRAFGIRTTFQLYAEIKQCYKKGRIKHVVKIYENNAKYLHSNCEKTQLSSILQKYVECQNVALYKQITDDESDHVELAASCLKKACETLGIWS